MTKQGTDASVIKFLQTLKKMGLVSTRTYLRIGSYMISHGAEKKSAWRQANWKSFLAGG